LMIVTATFWSCWALSPPKIAFRNNDWGLPA
jgi:hypothetical protein